MQLLREAAGQILKIHRRFATKKNGTDLIELTIRFTYKRS
jgi:hypothetical protein